AYGHFSLYFLYGFAIGMNRTVTFNAEGRSISLVADDLKFEFIDGQSFANGFTMEFIDQSLSTVGDDGSTRVLKPIYSGDDSAIGTYLVNLVDESSALLKKKNFSFAGGNRGDAAFGYLHKLEINFGVVADPAKRAWLRDFCLWKNKQIDTTGIDSIYGKVYNVVGLDKEIAWKFQNNVGAAPAVSLSFAETTLRREREYVPTSAQSQLDVSHLDSTAIGG
ncbi:MAG TPA: hypothetical protein VKS81_00605, partial [Bacteroidota bacterium]|nr:hypothetical protein [Bacteroidota bacterium]